MKYIVASLIILSVIQSAHAAERLRDLSLSVEQTNEQLRNPPVTQQQTVPALGAGNTNSGNSFNDNSVFEPVTSQPSGKFSDLAKSHSPLNGAFPPLQRGQAQGNYINQFCGAPIIFNNQQCQEDQRQQTCERFTRATVNAQRILSQAIDCELSSTGLVNKTGCDGLDAGRLDLLKQSWQDEDLSYTILFLPDMVLNVVASCSGKR